MYKDVNSVRVPETVMHREPRGAESAEIAFGEVRPNSRRGERKYPRTFSALRRKRGVFARKTPEAKWNSVNDAFALLKRGGFFVWEEIYV